MGDINDHGQLRWDIGINDQQDAEVQYIVAWSSGNAQSISNGYINYNLDGDAGSIYPIVKPVDSAKGSTIANKFVSGDVLLDIKKDTKLVDSIAGIEQGKYIVAVVGGYGRPAGLEDAEKAVADVYITAIPNTSPLPKDAKNVLESDKFSQPVTLTFNVPQGSILTDVGVCAWRKDAYNIYKWDPIPVEQNDNSVTITTDQIGHFTLMSNTSLAPPVSQRKQTDPVLENVLNAADAAARAAKAAAEAAEAAIAAVRGSSGPYIAS